MRRQGAQRALLVRRRAVRVVVAGATWPARARRRDTRLSAAARRASPARVSRARQLARLTPSFLGRLLINLTFFLYCAHGKTPENKDIYSEGQKDEVQKACRLSVSNRVP